MGNDGGFMVKRDFKKNPITLDEQLHCIWYAVVDDTIGGYAISNVNEPVSQLNPYEGKFEFANFVKQEIAEHVANLHNKWYREFVDDSYKDNFMATWNREYYEQELEQARWQVDSYDDLD